MECESPEPHPFQDDGEDNLASGKSVRLGRVKALAIEKLSNPIPLHLLLNLPEGNVNQYSVMLLKELN